MKLRILFVLMILLMPFAYSEVIIKNIQKAYNLGEQISPEVRIDFPISYNGSFVGFLKGEINCTSYYNDFYKIPLNIEKPDTLTTINLQPLPVFPLMKGACTIRVSMESYDSTFSQEKTSNDFDVTDELSVEIEDSNQTLNPGETPDIKGGLYNARNEPVKGLLTAVIAGKEYKFSIPDSVFDVKLPVSSTIKSGENEVTLSFEDADKNSIQKIISVEIIPRPTSVAISMAETAYLPYHNFVANILLLDQANDSMDNEMAISVTKDKKIIINAVQQTGPFTFLINNSLIPGKYTLKAVYDKLSTEQSFDILSYLGISSKVDNQSVIITNTGNINYRNTTEIKLQKNQTTYVVTRAISLKPSEITAIDLSKEVPEGSYVITLPTGETARDVHIDDHRSLMKKTSDGFSSFTGNAIKDVNANRTIGFIVLIIIIVIAVVAYLYFVPRKKARTFNSGFGKNKGF